MTMINPRKMVDRILTEPKLKDRERCLYLLFIFDYKSLLKRMYQNLADKKDQKGEANLHEDDRLALEVLGECIKLLPEPEFNRLSESDLIEVVLNTMEIEGSDYLSLLSDIHQKITEFTRDYGANLTESERLLLALLNMVEIVQSSRKPDLARD